MTIDSSVLTAAFTGGLLLATLVLAGATIWLVRETNATRKQEIEHRAREAVVRGVEPFMGRYAEKGRIDVGADGKLVQGYTGAILEVNFWGVYFLAPGLGAFAGGYAELSDESLVIEMGHIEAADKVAFVTATLTRTGTRASFQQERARQGIEDRFGRLPDDWTDWRLDLCKAVGDKWETIRSVKLTRYDTRLPRTFWRGSAHGKPFDI